VNTADHGILWGCWCSGGLITVLDVNSTPGGPFAALQTGSESESGATGLYESGGRRQPVAGGGTAAHRAGYHGAVAPFCAAARARLLQPT